MITTSSPIATIATCQVSADSYMAWPKTLAERLAWMTENLRGFREELDAVTDARARAIVKARDQL